MDDTEATIVVVLTIAILGIFCLSCMLYNQRNNNNSQNK